MASLRTGFTVLLLTWTQIISADDSEIANIQTIENIPGNSVSSKILSGILQPYLDEDQHSNNLAKRSVETFQGNQPSYDFYNTQFFQPASSPYSNYQAWQPQYNPSWQSQYNKLWQSQYNPTWQPQYNPTWQSQYNPTWRSQYYYPNHPYYTELQRPAIISRFSPPRVNFNLGYPIDNPPINYLPTNTKCQQPQPCTNTGKGVNDRFGDDGPVWDSVPQTTLIQPTRRPLQRPVTHPPLIHNSHDDDTKDDLVPAATSSGVKQPSRCVWAIVSCCSAASNKISYNCFEQLGCVGAFWGSNPCETEYARSAINTVMKYYQSQ